LKNPPQTAYNKAYYAKHSAKLRNRIRCRRKEDPERLRRINRTSYRKHRLKTLVTMRAWKQKHPAQVTAFVATRRAKKLKATPRWANFKKMQETYHLAKLMQKLLKKEYHVDHIVPLSSAEVCGLNVEHNLQVLSAADNAAKSNKRWPYMPRKVCNGKN
jgi:hypothetical protein